MSLQSQLAESGKLDVWNRYNAGQISREQAMASLGGGGGTSSGAGVEAAKKYSSGLMGLLGTQKTEEAGLFKQYETALAGQEKLPAMYSRISQELGIPGQQKVVGGLRNELLRIEGLLENLPEDVTQYTRGKFVTAAGRRRLEAQRTEPLARAMSTTGRAQARATGALGEMTGALGTQMQLLTAEQQKELTPIKMKIDAFGERAAREISGYTTAAQMELDAILSKIASDQAVTEAEMGRAHQLTLLEKQFELEKEELSTQITTVGGRVKLINTKTGAVIADLGASSTGTGTASERTVEENKKSLEATVKEGATVESVVNLYGDKLSLSDIKDIYNKHSPYGTAKEGGAQWQEEMRRAQQGYGTIKEEEGTDNKESEIQAWMQYGMSREQATAMANL